VVDDAIVMLENIVRHMEMGKPPMEAAFVGAREVGFTIFSMTLSLTAVFIPILFLGGIIGRLFHEFAVVIAVSILVSGFVSLTLTPMLASRFLKPHSNEQHGRMYTAIEDFWDRVLGLYGRTLAWVMDHRRVAMAFSLLILIGTGVLYTIVPKGFLPSEDTGRVNGTTEAAQGTSYDEMVRRQQQVAAIVARDTNIAGFMSAVGGGGGANTSINQGRFFIGLKPHKNRVSADDFIQELRAKIAHVPGMQVFFSNPPTIQIGARTAKGLYQFTMQSGDIDELYPASQKLIAAARGSKQLQDVTSDLQLGNPQASIVIDRERAASLGVTTEQI
jgi:HAE1 family hydrophobic/amphiphilic exporter-1